MIQTGSDIMVRYEWTFEWKAWSLLSNVLSDKNVFMEEYIYRPVRGSIKKVFTE